MKKLLVITAFFGALSMIGTIIFALLFAVPITVFFVYPLIEGALAGLGWNPYLVKLTAFGVSFVASLALLKLAFSLRWWKRMAGLAVLGVIAVGIWYLKYAFSEQVGFTPEGVAVKSCVMNPLGELECSYKGSQVTKWGIKAQPLTQETAALVELKERYRGITEPGGEVHQGAVRDRKILDDMHFFDAGGKPLMTVCVESNGVIRLYIGPGFCQDGRPREPVTKPIIELLKIQTATHTQILKEKEGFTRDVDELKRQVGVLNKRVALKLTRTLARGSKGYDVAVLQHFLSGDATIYPEGKVTGFFGPATERAVQRFQLIHHIVPADRAGSVVVGPRTRSSINALMSQDFKPAQGSIPLAKRNSPPN